MKEQLIYIIANPFHSLGFLVMTDTEPVGFNNPIKSLITLEQLRKKYGDHLKLYKTIPIMEPFIMKSILETYNRKNGIKHFNYNIIREYLKEG